MRDEDAGTAPSFDLRSWQGLTEVLKRGKESLADPHAYAEFRNLVLSYAQQGGNAELRKQIDSIVASFTTIARDEASLSEESAPAPARKIVDPPVTKTEEAPPSEVPPKRVGIGMRRLAPRFSASVSKPKPVVLPTKTESTPPPRPAAPKPEPTPVPPDVTTPKPTTPSSPKPMVAEKSPAEQASEPVYETKPASGAPPAPMSEPAPTSASSVKEASTGASSSFKSLDEHKARIAEIKRLVNAQIGNPATLIDTHNEIGKRYMKSLLNALKATGGGGGNVDDSMAELESAFDALRNDAPEAKSGTVPAIPPAPEPTPEPVAEEVPRSDTPMPAVKEEAPEWDARADAIQKNDEKILSVMRDMQKDRSGGEVADLASAIANGRTEAAVKEAVVAEVPKAPREPEPMKVASAMAEAPRNRVDFVPQNKNVVREVGKRPIEDVKKETGVDPREVAIKQTELSSPEITEALHQLLNEWSIFRGRGFFGMGPSGPEHPLYHTLAPLSMGEVIAGRWEGSDRKLTKMIKQYVDAWRHEQGIAYVITETFEHYLRRVVQRIMKRGQGGGA
ncbi:MAG TPA: hypothetical protein VFS75_02225 [Candidatus Paceibacterota bacterium]|nr:hypothetical protein [Candidatus Paceibacterota bacterium]